MNIKTIYVYIYCIITYTICPYSSVVERLPCIITMKAKGLEFKSRWELLY